MSPQTTYHPNKDQDWTRFVRSMSDGISSHDETDDAPYGGAVGARIGDGDDASFAMNMSFLPIVGPVVSENDEERKQREDLDLLAAIFVRIMMFVGSPVLSSALFERVELPACTGHHRR